MVIETEVKPRCGDCQQFDIKDCRGEPLGITNVKGIVMRNGFCRAPNGLLLRVVNETSECQQPHGTFKQKT